MLACKIRKTDAEKARLLMTRLGALDRDHRILVNGDIIDIPITRKLSDAEIVLIEEMGGSIGQLSETLDRERFYDPMKEILVYLDIPKSAKEKIPKKWELMGNVLVIKLDNEVVEYKSLIAEVYAKILNVKTVLWDTGGIKGEYREPQMDILLGDETVTTHLENGIKYCLDAARLMFASGNVNERIRMASVCEPGETVVDMFAGIGYFTLPMAVHSDPKNILAYDINPLAHEYLLKNVALNNVEDVVEARLANCLEAEEGVADRVIMGYVGRTHEYLPKAMRILNEKGIIHYHETCPDRLLPDRPLDRVRKAAEGEGKTCEVLNVKTIKSYAPGVSHVVVDVAID